MLGDGRINLAAQVERRHGDKRQRKLALANVRHGGEHDHHEDNATGAERRVPDGEVKHTGNHGGDDDHEQQREAAAPLFQNRSYQQDHREVPDVVLPVLVTKDVREQREVTRGPVE